MPMLVATIAAVLAGLAAAALRRDLRIERRIDELRLTIQLLERRFTMERAATARRWWSVLGIARSATPAEIDAAYRARIKGAHPDTGGDGDADLIERLRRARQAGLHDAARRAGGTRVGPAGLEPATKPL